jgi:hypothetical protein
MTHTFQREREDDTHHSLHRYILTRYERAGGREQGRQERLRMQIYVTRAYPRANRPGWYMYEACSLFKTRMVSVMSGSTSIEFILDENSTLKKRDPA